MGAWRSTRLSAAAARATLPASALLSIGTSGRCNIADEMSKVIEDYGLIGNMVSAALVSRDGSIDWLCLPRFDSAACFAALLGDPGHGRWLIAPRDSSFASRRRYLPGTAVLETTFETGSGVVSVTDFMPLTEDESKVDVVRVVRGIRGAVDVDMELALRFNYGQAIPWVRRRDYGLSAVAGPDSVELHTPVALQGRDMRTVANFTVREGATVPFTLSYHPSHKAPHFVADRTESLARTASWWAPGSCWRRRAAHSPPTVRHWCKPSRSTRS